MGAQDFLHSIPKAGKTAQQAFDDLTHEARYQHGHGGYTGTIAEKSQFRMVRLPAGVDPDSVNYDTPFNGWNAFDDKWGDAGCIDAGDNWIFFGSASS